MANKKYTELPQANAITGAEILAMVQDGGSVQGDIDLIKAYFDTLYAPTGQGVKTYITAQATAARVTSAAPDAIGEYRSYLRNAGARAYTETNGTPGTAPSSSNGYRMYIPTDFATADASGEPSRYEIYIGLNKDPMFEFYSSTGRTGLIFTKPFQRWGGSDVNGGIETHYDPTTGIARVIHQTYNGGSNYTGLDFSGGLVTADIYFDIKC